ncbi:MAG: hypothetical protein N2486_10665, partial [Caloramator sp.]|nr:hypothetical protein [Caloramator sp.]
MNFKRISSFLLSLILILLFITNTTNGKALENNQLNFNFEKVYQYDQELLTKIKDLKKFDIDIRNIDYSKEVPIVNVNVKFALDDIRLVKIEDIQGEWKKQYKNQIELNTITFSKKYEKDKTLTFTIIWKENDYKNATGSGILYLAQDEKPVLFSMGPKDMEEIDKVLRKKDNSNFSAQLNSSVIVLSNPNENCIYNYNNSSVSMRISLNRPN